MKTISIRLNDYEQEMLEMYTEELKKSFEGLKVGTSMSLKRALYYAAYNDPCAHGKIAKYETEKLIEKMNPTKKHICEQKDRKKQTIKN